MAITRVLVAVFKTTGKIKVYGSLPAFISENQAFKDKVDKINYRISRLKTHYEDEKIKLYKKEVKRGKRQKKL